ncbi:MAG: 50S ribosomal protein L18 [Oligoflexia bacterium]|nr:50S ribosomal protein L18 [Oligoflexia bacterium]
MYVKSKTFKTNKRLRKKIRIRKRLSGTEQKPRVSVFRSARHTYAQVISDATGKTMAAASTKDQAVLDAVAKVKTEEGASKSRSPKSVAAAIAVGMVLGARIQEQKIKELVFDRNGFVFHGRIKAVADGLRQSGVKI